MLLIGVFLSNGEQCLFQLDIFSCLIISFLDASNFFFTTDIFLLLETFYIFIEITALQHASFHQGTGL